MSEKLYVVTLTVEERSFLKGLVSKGVCSALKQRHARLLLKADVGPQGQAWPDEQIAQALEMGVRTVARVRQRFVEDGLEAALKRKEQQKRKARVFDGAAEAHLIAQACSKAPEGRARWTLRLLADRMVELNIVDGVCHETVRQALKKTNLSLG
jgi:transposase